ncbi:DUF6745 domain-containing protein [Rhizobium sp. RCAM05973]|uniref:DUF6745 domain-containing protein n=1 Tax=Rhizobium sp. RCAM05973 TaxID=2994066 RepID=UPI0022EC0477|nr:hypothetical protein [Rhizobium sp. RCAM05973]
MKIEKLTPEQEAMIPTIRDEFLRIGLSTEPADFDAAEQAIKDAYAVANLPAPKLFIRLASPHEGAIGAAILKNTRLGENVRDQVWDQVRAQVGDQVRAQVGDQVWDQVRAQVGDQVGAQVWDQVRAQVWDQVRAQVGDQVWDQVGDQVWDQVRAQVGDQVGAQVWDQVGDQVWAQVGDQVWDQVSQAFYSQHEAGWLSWLAFFRRVCDLPNTEKIEPLLRIAQSCGWVWFFAGAVIMTDRPRTLKRDEQNRLHCETGLAIEYRDGFGISAWHGTRVPHHWISDRANLDPNEVIKASNVEQRAAGAAIIGWPKMLTVLKAKTVDKHANPDIGELIELTLPGLPEPGRFLKAVCPRNGIICEGVPRVSDIDGLPINTALAAQAWRIGDPQSEYIHPERRT